MIDSVVMFSRLPPAADRHSPGVRSGLVEADDAGEVDSKERFGALYEEYRPRALAWARRFGAQGDRADDVVSEAFEKAWKGYGRFRGEASFGTWLYQILRNTIFDGRVPRENELTAAHREREALSPESLFEGRTIASRIDAAIARLSDSQRQVFLMKEFDGMKHAEIAARLGIAVGTSKVHYFLALKRLREDLHDLV